MASIREICISDLKDLAVFYWTDNKNLSEYEHIKPMVPDWSFNSFGLQGVSRYITKNKDGIANFVEWFENATISKIAFRPAANKRSYYYNADSQHYLTKYVLSNKNFTLKISGPMPKYALAEHNGTGLNPSIRFQFSIDMPPNGGMHGDTAKYFIIYFLNKYLSHKFDEFETKINEAFKKYTESGTANSHLKKNQDRIHKNAVNKLANSIRGFNLKMSAEEIEFFINFVKKIDGYNDKAWSGFGWTLKCMERDNSLNENVISEAIDLVNTELLLKS